jgi:hypothetical protein
MSGSLKTAVVIFDDGSIGATNPDDFRFPKLDDFIKKKLPNKLMLSTPPAVIVVKMSEDIGSSGNSGCIDTGSDETAGTECNANASSALELLETTLYELYYVASFCKNLTFLNRSIKKHFSKVSALAAANKSVRNSSHTISDSGSGTGDSHEVNPVQIVILEDLIWVDRVYISTTPVNKFFLNMRQLDDSLESCKVVVLSSNEVLNSYGGRVGTNTRSRTSHENTSSNENSHTICSQIAILSASNESSEKADTYVVPIPPLQIEATHYWNEIQHIKFYEMLNRGAPVPRLVAIQSLRNEFGSRPLYRHPNDVEPPNKDMVSDLL